MKSCQEKTDVATSAAAAKDDSDEGSDDVDEMVDSRLALAQELLAEI